MISTKGRYALRVMIDLAEHADEGYVPLKEVADRQEISKKYLEIIVRDLVKGNLLIGASGKGGGYRLCRKPEEYTVWEILECMECSLATVACLTDGVDPCPRAADCKTLPMWEEFDGMVKAYFTGKRLSDMVLQ